MQMIWNKNKPMLNSFCSYIRNQQLTVSYTDSRADQATSSSQTINALPFSPKNSTQKRARFLFDAFCWMRTILIAFFSTSSNLKNKKSKFRCGEKINAKTQFSHNGWKDWIHGSLNWFQIDSWFISHSEYALHCVNQQNKTISHEKKHFKQ